VVAETEKNACISILFLIYVAMFALIKLIPRIYAQLLEAEVEGKSNHKLQAYIYIREGFMVKF